MRHWTGRYSVFVTSQVSRPCASFFFALRSITITCSCGLNSMLFLAFCFEALLNECLYRCQVFLAWIITNQAAGFSMFQNRPCGTPLDIVQGPSPTTHLCDPFAYDGNKFLIQFCHDRLILHCC